LIVVGLVLGGNAYLTFADVAFDIPPGFPLATRQDKPQWYIVGIFFLDDNFAPPTLGA
jgi:hypothetical protein